MSLIFNVDGLSAEKNKNLAERRFGRFMFSNAILESCPTAMQKIFSKVIPVNVTFDYARNVFEVTGISEHFDTVEEMHTIPFYAVQVRQYNRKNKKTDHDIPTLYVDFIKIEGQD